MSNSSLVAHTNLSPHCTKMSDKVNRKITIHHMAGNLSIEACGRVFQNSKASANYGIGSDGRIGMYVEEKDRAWSTANPENDRQAVNIEVANDERGGNWHVSDKALASLIDLCVDICKRNGIDKLTYTGDKTGNLTRHNMFIGTACPGPYLQSKFPWIAEQVNARLDVGSYDDVYIVKSGDSLWSVADRLLGDGERWPEIQSLNDLSGTVIHPGQKLKIPSSHRTHLVTSGDTLWDIAAKYLGSGTRYREIMEYNGLTSDVINVGTTLLIPKK